MHKDFHKLTVQTFQRCGKSCSFDLKNLGSFGSELLQGGRHNWGRSRAFSMTSSGL